MEREQLIRQIAEGQRGPDCDGEYCLVCDHDVRSVLAALDRLGYEIVCADHKETTDG